MGYVGVTLWGCRLALVLLVASAMPAGAVSLAPGSLADAARAAGVFVGAAIEPSIAGVPRDLAATEFTSLTAENASKWGGLAPTPGAYEFTRSDAVVDFAAQNGQRVRGHTLFWSRFNGTPTWVADEVRSASDPAARLSELMRSHAQTTVGRYAGRIAQWDVVNEPLAIGGGELDPLNFFSQILGESYLDIAFEAAHAADPTAQLFLNETFIQIPAKFDGLLRLAQRMIDRGVPLHGLGLQGHFLFAPPDRTTLQDQLQRVSDLGLLVELTEVDIPLGLFAAAADPLAAQANAYADVFNACLAVAACTGITTWGVDDRATWLDGFPTTAINAPNRPLLFDEMGRPKLAYEKVVGVLRAAPEPGVFGLLGMTVFGFAIRGRA